LSHGEDLFLKYGIYNLGFIEYEEPMNPFVFWTGGKTGRSILGLVILMQVFCGSKMDHLVPLLFEGISISRHVGLNAAFWNLHERTISERNGVFFINKTTELVFYHFSQFNPNKNDIASNHNRYSFEIGPTPFHCSGFTASTFGSRYNYFKAFSCHYVAILQEIKKNRFMEKVNSGIRNAVFVVDQTDLSLGINLYGAYHEAYLDTFSILKHFLQTQKPNKSDHKTHC